MAIGTGVQLITEDGGSMAGRGTGMQFIVDDTADWVWTDHSPEPGDDTWDYYECVFSTDASKVLTNALYFPLWVSANNGDSWTEHDLGAGSIDNGAMSSDGSVMYMVFDTKVFISLNYGVSWSDVTPPRADWPYYWNYMYQCDCSSDGSKVYVGSSGSGLHYSPDYGQSWYRPDFAAGINSYDIWLTRCSSDGSVAIIGGAVGDNGLYLTTNTGIDWTRVDPDGSSLNYYWDAGHVSPDGSTIYVGAWGRMYKSTDTGSSWTELQPAGDADKDWARIDASDDGTIVIACENGYSSLAPVYLSEDSGDTWTDITSNFSDYDWLHGVRISGDGSTLGVYGEYVYFGEKDITNRGAGLQLITEV